MRVLVCGGRNWTNTAATYIFLDGLKLAHQIDAIIEGDARGADRMAGYWARKAGIDNLKFPADWKGLGKRAGYVRNKQMLDEGRPDLVVAFPGGRGTAMMIDLARKAGVRVVEPMEGPGSFDG